MNRETLVIMGERSNRSNLVSGIASSLVLLLFVLSSCVARSYAENVPKPQGRVSDYAGVISDDYRQKLTALIEQVEAKTTAEIAVVAIDSIAPHDEQSYARMIFDSWKIGKKGKDNGVLVLLAVKERRWRIESGYDIEGILPDGKCGEIGRAYMVPLFREGKYGEGLYQGVLAIARIIAIDAHADLDGLSGADEPVASVSPPGPAVFMYIFVPIFFFVWNLPWPVYIGMPVTVLFALVFAGMSPLLGALAIGSYVASMIYRFSYWRKLPRRKRASFFGTQTYGGVWTTYSGSGGWSGGGGFGGGGGGFGGGGSGGGGAGGGF